MVWDDGSLPAELRDAALEAVSGAGALMQALGQAKPSLGSIATASRAASAALSRLATIASAAEAAQRR
jgi:hypothetical protein